MLQLERINAGYGKAQVLHDLTLNVQPGEIHCLLGRNGAGKTTLMRAIMGLVPLMSGAISLNAQSLSTRPAHQVPRAGIGYVPQGRRLFAELTVAQNLTIGMMTRSSPRQVLEDVVELFPRLRARWHSRARTLSGGEQQMLAMARALCIQPDILLLDEPTEGLQPSMRMAIREVMLRKRSDGAGILLVDQHIDSVLDIADRVTFLQNGRQSDTYSTQDLRQSPDILQTYLGV